jgi:BCD family chlorophyll transporter-like MFS transporter
VTGVILSPQAAFAMSQDMGRGLLLGALAFGAWGMGYNLASVSYLSLASELSGAKGRGRTVAVMFFMMITSIIFTAILLSHIVDPYSAAALARGFWLVGAVAALLGLVGVLGLESRSRKSPAGIDSDRLTWKSMYTAILENRQATLFFWYLIILLAAILGQDILLEPFGGEAFGLSVRETTRITSIWGGCMLVALLAAGLLEGRVKKQTVAFWGGLGALFGFLLITASGLMLSQGVFYSGVVLLGAGTGLATTSNLSLMLDMTTPGNVGLFIGAWGMANAFSRLIGSVLGGAVRDLVTHLANVPLSGYIVVFGIEAAMLLVSLFMLGRINVSLFQAKAEMLSPVERAAVANEA